MLKLNILLVEDSPLMARSLKQILLSLGHHVVGIAESYDEALHLLADCPIDMVITDIIIKGDKNGIDLGNYIKRCLQIPLIYQSSTTDQGLIEKALMTEPVAYLSKPVNKAALSAALMRFEAV